QTIKHINKFTSTELIPNPPNNHINIYLATTHEHKHQDPTLIEKKTKNLSTKSKDSYTNALYTK
ncbi:hypothetical protein ACQWE9_25530, partial [Salmonella enterica subsp. enterica serovar Infantis]